jgi:hypothetical protein
MSTFYEETIFEFPSLVKRKTWTKEIRYRFRVVRRKDHNGIVRAFLDMREFKIDEHRALFTENGLYFTVEELDNLIQVIIKAKDKILHPNKGE